jgi:hypothetical protein
MSCYRYVIYARTDKSWRFFDAFCTEEAADKKAYSLDGRVKMLERYETPEGKIKVFRIFYFYNGKYSHQVTREI